MELITTPDIYSPNIDENGNYVDYIPINIQNITCPCSKINKTYNCKKNFSKHILTQRHNTWLINLNRNKSNHYVQYLKYRDLSTSQQKIIKKYENELSKKDVIINYLQNELINKKKENIIENIDLLDINDIDN